MYKLINKLLLFVLVLFFNINLNATELTTNIARKMNFYDLQHNLRLKVDEHLSDIETAMEKQIRSFRDQQRYRLANKMIFNFTQAMLSYSHEVDSAFDNISQILVTGGQKLDYDEASVREKIRFIQYVRSELVRSFEDLMQLNIDNIEGSFYAY